MVDWVAILLPSRPLLELVVRGTVVYLALLAMARVAGQRESGGLGLTDLLVVVLVAEAASNGLQGDSTAIGDGLVLVAVIFFWSVLIDALAYRFPTFSRIVKARPRTLVEDGRPNRRAMRRELMTGEELLTQLRLHGIENLDEVRRALLEPNGMVSIVRRDGAEPGEADRPPAVG
jgi:uncharacterized membrane protein YcaP (DUF421 family)